LVALRLVALRLVALRLVALCLVALRSWLPTAPAPQTAGPPLPLRARR